MTPQQTQLLVSSAIVALIAWRLQSRVRRLIGRQRLSPVRPWINVVLFPVLIALLALGTRVHPLAGLALAGGAVLGITLGVLGLKLTRFEVTPAGLYYTPSAHIGVALAVLVVCRIGWRLLTQGLPEPAAGSAPPGAALTPLTLLLLGTLAGYYWTYAVGLLRWLGRSRGLSRGAQSTS